MILKKIRRLVLFGTLSLALLMLTFYGAFLIILKVTEAKWLGAPPFHEATEFYSTEPHTVALIDNGADSLALRLRMIQGALTSIDLEFFIYELDTSSRLITQAIAERAKAGVKVRVLVDFSLAVFKLRPVYARMLHEAGVEVKYYNTASLARFFRMQHRTHRKMVIVDGTSAIIGGRNIADDYFDLGDHYNFLDSDVLVEGPAVKSIRESFDLYWQSDWAVPPGSDDAGAPISDLTVPNEKDVAAHHLITTLKTGEVRTTCNDLQFVTDYPGSGVNFRRVYPAITKVMATAKKEVLAESPYFVLRKDGQDVIKALTERGVKLRVLTNSLRSTDAYYTVAPLFLNLKRISMAGFQLYAYGGYPLENYGQFAARSERWGVHAKRAVIDDSTVMIGTYNIDPRSANLNSELMLICRNNVALAIAMRASIEARIKQSNLVLDGSNEPFLGALTGNAERNSYLMMLLSVPLSSMFDFLL